MLKSLVAILDWIRTRAFPGVKTVLSPGRYGASAALLGLLFTGLYLFSIQHIVYFSGVDLSLQASIPSIEIVSGWTGANVSYEGICRNAIANIEPEISE